MSNNQDRSATPLVSVILTSYNYAPYLRQAVDSVLGQTYENFELFAVDDGSTDGSPQVLESYSDPRMHVICQKNGGQASAWNRAYLQSKGELILFLDSDDWWEPAKIERMVAIHLAMQRGYAVLQHDLTVFRDGNEYPYRRILPSGDCLSEMRQTGRISFFVTSSGIGIPRWVAEKVFPVPEALRISPDAFLTRAAFVFGPVMSIPESLGHLRLHGGNAGMTQEQEFHENLRRETIFPALNEFYRKHSVAYEFKAPPRQNAVMRLARKILRRIVWRLGLQT